jgi:NCAIR mutase (PurE)-related protein
MDTDRLQAILDAVSRGECTVEQAMERLRHLPFEDLEFAKLDMHRSLRQGMAEVIFCPGKTAGQVVEIAKRLTAHHRVVLASKASPQLAASVLEQIPEAVYNQLGGMLIFGKLPHPDESLPKVAVLTAGTADLSVAEEAAVILQSQAIPVLRVSDVGVAGIHRLFDKMELLHQASVVIVAAGMDGALPSVIGGLLAVPVIAVPTSVGYGTSFQGLAALLTMLNSCAAGITVVNIDNGFGAASAAIRLITTIKRQTSVQRPPGSVSHC